MAQMTQRVNYSECLAMHKCQNQMVTHQGCDRGKSLSRTKSLGPEAQTDSSPVPVCLVEPFSLNEIKAMMLNMNISNSKVPVVNKYIQELLFLSPITRQLVC